MYIHTDFDKSSSDEEDLGDMLADSEIHKILKIIGSQKLQKSQN